MDIMLSKMLGFLRMQKRNRQSWNERKNEKRFPAELRAKKEAAGEVSPASNQSDVVCTCQTHPPIFMEKRKAQTNEPLS
jgi:hypothetical protein